MIKYILIALIMVLHLNAKSDLTEEFLQMSDKQVEALTLAYNQGGYNLAAIAWQESQAGKFRIGINRNNSVDLGLFHMNSKSFLSRWYKEHPDKFRTPYYDNVVLSKILVDDAYASIYAQKEFDYWHKDRHRNIRDTIKSYNCGNNINRARCDKYLKKVNNKRSVLFKHLQVGRYWYRGR